MSQANLKVLEMEIKIMNRSKLILLACPALLAYMLLGTNPAQASAVVAQPIAPAESASTKPLFEVVFEQPTADPMTNSAIDDSECGCGSDSMLQVTDQDSNAAIARFGCDCAGCLNALRQLQGKPLML